MDVKYKKENLLPTNSAMVDVMKVGDKLRWAKNSGSQNTTPDATIVGFRSKYPCKVVVRAGGESSPFRSVKFAETEDGTVYLAGHKWMERIDGEIIRIRDQTL